jgi:hypothetical protein
MERDIPTYRIDHLIKLYIKSIKQNHAENEDTNTCLNTLDDSHILPSYGKKNQLMEQIISHAIVRFRTCEWGKKEQRIPGDILSDLSAVNRRRTVYGTLIKDSRGR